MTILAASQLTKLSVALTLLTVVSACQQAPTDDIAIINYQSVASQALHQVDHYQITQTFTGTIRAGNTTGVGFELSGKIQQLAVDSGDKVAKGQLLAELDTVLLEAEKQELNASINQNHADLALAQSTLDRSLALREQGYTSEQTLDELKGQLNSLKAAKSRLTASLKANQLRIEKSTLTAPFSGTISKRNNNLGEVVTAGTPLFTLVQDNNPQANVGVTVNIAQTLNSGDNLPLVVGSRQYMATIAGIGAEVNPVTRTVDLRLRLPTDAKVINGELAYLKYNKSMQQTGFWVPVAALTDGLRGLWNLYVLTPSDDNKFIVERRDVEILYTRDEQAFIVGAIKNDEHFVSQGLHKLVVGQKVNVTTDMAARSL
ncbi:efflux RND transporter periplasmic adaptor subunit [Shewanella waksmanii]|uniref:efflux RND transporter periplasmic adaptor subunit n=1 Tax=Shewanella waksmanii TaxID=213783 RepID=UPI003736401C